MQTIDSNTSLYTLIKQNPAIKDIMVEIGFQDITKPGMLQTAGRYMTIPKGAKMKKISLDKVKATFLAHGFELTNL
jgi:hypothetical protein